jgi:hypothetical protein
VRRVKLARRAESLFACANPARKAESLFACENPARKADSLFACENPARPSKSLFIRALALALVVSLTLSLIGCASRANEKTLTLADGASLRWSPAEPRIGDLVELVATLPSDAAEGAQANADQSLFDADGIALPSISSLAKARSREYRWAFRAAKTGSWTWQTSGKRQTLWAVASEANGSAEMKTVDAQYLWTGKGKRPEQSAKSPQGSAKK